MHVLSRVSRRLRFALSFYRLAAVPVSLWVPGGGLEPLGEANRQKVKLTKMALNHLQEPRDIKIR